MPIRERLCCGSRGWGDNPVCRSQAGNTISEEVEMSRVKRGDTVKVQYTGRLENGDVFDASGEKEPVKLKIGNSEVIPGFEQAIMGMTPGESKTTKISALRAYGPHREELVVEIEKERINDDIEPQIGQRLQIKQPDGQEFIVTVTEVSDQKVKLDANHPLAGKDLIFDINLIEIVDQ
jgi:peptidylprolyl isomerase